MARRFVPILFFVLSGCIIAVAFWVLLGDLQPAKPPKPMLVFTPETVHFGTVPQGIEHGTAMLANVSTKPIVVKAVIKGCDCSEVLIKQGQILPGEQREMSFQWDTRGQCGNNTISITVLYTVEDNPTERFIPLIIGANIIPDYEIVPEKLEFVSDKQDKQQISLTSTEGNFVTIRDIIVHHPAFSTVVAPDMQSATITFDPDKLTDGTRYMQIRIVTTSENQPIFLLPINIHVVRGH